MLIASRKVGEWGDPLTPPQSKTECSGYASGKYPWPIKGSWKTCNAWKTEWRHMEVEAFLDFYGPANLAADALAAAEACAVVAAAAAGAVAIATTGAAAAAAAQVVFIKCMETKGIQEADKCSVTFRTAGHWTDWT